MTHDCQITYSYKDGDRGVEVVTLDGGDFTPDELRALVSERDQWKARALKLGSEYLEVRHDLERLMLAGDYVCKVAQDEAGTEDPVTAIRSLRDTRAALTARLAALEGALEGQKTHIAELKMIADQADSIIADARMYRKYSFSEHFCSLFTQELAGYDALRGEGS